MKLIKKILTIDLNRLRYDHEILSINPLQNQNTPSSGQYPTIVAGNLKRLRIASL